MTEWYTEIMNTYLMLEIDQGNPIKFLFKTMLPFDQIDMSKQYHPTSESKQYLSSI